MGERKDMKYFEKIKEIASQYGIDVVVMGDSKYHINKGYGNAYGFRKNGEDVVAGISEEVIDDMDESQLEEVVITKILPSCGKSKYEPEVIEVTDSEDKFYDLLRSTGSIMPCVINTEANKEFIDTVVHRDVMDLSIIYRIVICDSECLSSAYVTKDMLEETGFSEEALFNRAKEYVKEHMKIISIGEALANSSFEVPEDSKDNMLVCRYENPNFGAGILAMAALDSSILGDYCEAYPVYVVPSSVNEILLFKDRCDDVYRIKELVERTNVHEVPVEELLSNSVYVLKPETKKIELAVHGNPLSVVIEEKDFFNRFFNGAFVSIDD